MAYSHFEPYREQVQAWKSQRVPKAEMLRRLHEENPEEGFLDKKSSFYPFVDSLGASSPNGLEQILQPLQEDIRQMHGSMQKILQAGRENDEKAVQRHQAVMQAVNQKSTPLVPELMGRHMSQTPFAPSQGAYSLPRK